MVPISRLWKGLRRRPGSPGADPGTERPSKSWWRRWRWPTRLLVLAHLVGFLSSFHALMSVRTPQGTIAWVVSLNTMPVVSVPAYWIFGRSKFQGYVIARKSEDADLAGFFRKLADDAARVSTIRNDEYGRLRAAERVASRFPAVGNNHVKLLIDGDESFDSILAGIDEAREYVLVQFYIVRDDGLGRRLKDAMLRQAARGVRVFFLYDEIGSYRLPSAYLRELPEGGVRATAFQSTRGEGTGSS
jgi:cardiolipin synthase